MFALPVAVNRIKTNFRNKAKRLVTLVLAPVTS